MGSPNPLAHTLLRQYHGCTKAMSHENAPCSHFSPSLLRLPPAHCGLSSLLLPLLRPFPVAVILSINPSSAHCSPCLEFPGRGAHTSCPWPQSSDFSHQAARVRPFTAAPRPAVLSSDLSTPWKQLTSPSPPEKPASALS